MSKTESKIDCGNIERDSEGRELPIPKGQPETLQVDPTQPQKLKLLKDILRAIVEELYL